MTSVLSSSPVILRDPFGPERPVTIVGFPNLLHGTEEEPGDVKPLLCAQFLLQKWIHIHLCPIIVRNQDYNNMVKINTTHNFLPQILQVPRMAGRLLWYNPIQRSQYHLTNAVYPLLNLGLGRRALFGLWTAAGPMAAVVEVVAAATAVDMFGRQDGAEEEPDHVALPGTKQLGKLAEAAIRLALPGPRLIKHRVSSATFRYIPFAFSPRMRQAPQAEGGDSQLEQASGTGLGFNLGKPTRSGSIMEGQRQPAATPPSADRPPSAALVPAASRLQSAALVPSSGRLQSAASLLLSLPSAASLPSASAVSTSTRTIRSTSPNEFPRIVFYHIREARLFGISPAVSLFRAQCVIPDGCLVHKFTGTIFRPEPLQFRRPDGLNTMERCHWKMFGPRIPRITAGLQGDRTLPDPNVFLRKEEALAQAFIKAQEKAYRMLMGETQSEVDEEDEDAAPVVKVDKGKQRQVNPALPAPQHDAEVVSSSSRPVRYVFAGVVLPEWSHRRLHSTTAATTTTPKRPRCAAAIPAAIPASTATTTTTKRPRRAAAIAASVAITSSSAAAGTGCRAAHPVDLIDLQAIMGGPADPIDIDVIMGGPADPIDVDDILGGPAHPINTDAVWHKPAGDIDIDIDDDMGIS
ncbi:hypothetical protein B0H21DRAFT_709834 [Amylocystis lapponica]|nr:hypothetical protein B0H21DRAFT_709834 [Amylocystis lapponica]